MPDLSAIARQFDLTQLYTISPSTHVEGWLDQFISADPSIDTLKAKVRALSQIDCSVLIEGESGVGKELIARALHGSRKGPFIPINCAEPSESLINSELFGHKAGSFTGANKDHLGLLRAAENGTIFLDEIAELPIGLQAKFLRVLQEREVRPVGGLECIPINCRFISATHHNLESMIDSSYVDMHDRRCLDCKKFKPFREDLFYRLATITISIPPIREREKDKALLIRHFLGLSQDTPIPDWIQDELLKDLTLRGNVRKIQHICQRYLVFKGKM